MSRMIGQLLLPGHNDKISAERDVSGKFLKKCGCVKHDVFLQESLEKGQEKVHLYNISNPSSRKVNKFIINILHENYSSGKCWYLCSICKIKIEELHGNSSTQHVPCKRKRSFPNDQHSDDVDEDCFMSEVRQVKGDDSLIHEPALDHSYSQCDGGIAA